MTIRFFHTADLHLESPFKGLFTVPTNIVDALRDSTLRAFEQLVTDALREKPDFIIIVGDIYDGENRSLTVQHKFLKQLNRLREQAIPVYISYGNHDHLSGSWSRFDLPDNVIEFGPDVEEHRLIVRGEEVVIHGFSYEKRHITEARIFEYPTKVDDAYHIGMLHGSVEGDVEHNVYAPFTVEQLLQKKYDYWALGHIHKRQILCAEPPIVYPGNIQGRHRKESGAKGYYDVTLNRDEAILSFKEVGQIRFDHIDISMDEVEMANQLLRKVEQICERYVEQNGAAVVTLTLCHFNEIGERLYMSESESEWLETIREQVATLEPFIWVADIDANIVHDSFEKTALSVDVDDQIAEFSVEQLQEIVSLLHNNPKVAKYLEPLSDEEWSSVQQQAQQLVKSRLQQNGGRNG